jgi:LemA protein
VRGGGEAAANPGTGLRDSGAEAGLNGALGRLFALAEAYPDFKANQNMLELSEELTSTENKVSFARKAYNDAVTAYNTQREMFPANIIAGLFNFAAAEPFQIQNGAERACQVRPLHDSVESVAPAFLESGRANVVPV